MVVLAKKRLTKKEMDKIYRRRRIVLSFIAVVIMVSIGYGGVILIKLITNDKEEIPQQEEQISNSEKETDKTPKLSEDTKGNTDTIEDKSQDKDNDLSSKPEQASQKVDTTNVQGASTDWNLILANPDTAVADDFKVETAVVQGTKEIDKRIVDIAKKMLDDAKKDGIDLLVCSGYRSVEKQQSLFDNSINGYVAQGYSKEDAIKYTKAYYAVPGTSEHHTGLAMDMVTPSYQTLDAKYAETDAAKWLLNNADKYGFILRYPKDKEDITKITFEPWHYRYVGEEHAKIMKEKNLCFEEYLKTLQ